jgi:hypothetical protein
MELCSLEDAFPEIGKKEGTPSREERKAAKKKAKRCKGPALEYLESLDATGPDPDRQAVKRLGEIPAFVPLSEAFPDLSGSSVEGFKLPNIPTNNCLFGNQDLPKYFGAGLDDDDDKKEGFQNLADIVPQTLPAGFDKNALEKAGSGGDPSSLPAPNLVDAWKPITKAKVTTAFFNELPTALRQKPAVHQKPIKAKVDTAEEEEVVSTPAVSVPSATDAKSRDIMLTRIQELTKRLEDLEKRSEPRNSQKELLMFVGAGLFLLISFDIVARSTR